MRRTGIDRAGSCSAGLSVSVRNPFGGGEIAFRLNGADGRLPSPMPVFDRWTRFGEDEIFD